jgi:hypothetical protein
MKPTLLVLLVFFFLLAPALCEQNYVTRYDVFAGYAYLNSPAIKLPEHGVQFQIGVRPKTWYSVGFDYSNARGDLTITPNLLPTALQQQLGATLAQLAAAGLVPPGYSLTVPAHSRSQTFCMGPQLAFRHFQKVTFFVRPSMGAIRELAIPFPSDPIAKRIVGGLTPSGKKLDWTGFYGAGGGFDLILSKHVAFRVQGDYVWDHLFNDLLKDGRRTLRLGIGPCFNFGKNIAQ